MNMSSTQKMHKKHAGHPPKASAQSLTTRLIAIIRSTAKGLACSLGVALLFLLLTTSLLTRAEDPVRWLYPAALAVLYITAVMCGASAMHFCRDTSWVCGLVSGGMLLVVCTLLGCFVSVPSAVSYPDALLTRIPIPFLSLLGATLVGKRPHRHTHRKH